MHVLPAPELLADELQLRPAGDLPRVPAVLEALRVREEGETAGVREGTERCYENTRSSRSFLASQSGMTRPNNL
jgi:hypothetical protein